MEYLISTLFLARLQFALTTAFHILWASLSVGLSVYLVVVEAYWLKTKEEVYYRQARFWSRLFLLIFAVGVVSGIPLGFQFGTNWDVFSIATGGFFGNLLGFEATMAFMLESAFMGVMLLGWNRVFAQSAFFFHGHGGPGRVPFRLLDHGGQLMDAVPGRRSHGGRRLCGDRLLGRHFQSRLVFWVSPINGWPVWKQRFSWSEASAPGKS